MDNVTKPSLLTQVRRVIRVKHYSRRTEEAYVGWMRRFIRFCGTRHPRQLGPSDVTRFLSSLAVDRNVSASTQNQALAALLFLYRDVLQMPVGWLETMVRAKKSLRVPVVFTKGEVRRVLAGCQGPRECDVGACVALRNGHAPPRGAAPAREGSRFRAQRDHRSCRQGQSRSHDYVARAPERSATASLGRHAQAARAGSRVWRGVGGSAGRARCEVSRRGPRVALAVGLSGHADLQGRGDWPTPASSSARDGGSAGVQGRPPEGGCTKGGQLSYSPAFLRHAPPRVWLRHSHCAGAPGPPGRRDDDGVYPCAQSWGQGSAESG